MRLFQTALIAIVLAALAGCGGSSDEPASGVDATVQTETAGSSGVGAADARQPDGGSAGSSNHSGSPPDDRKGGSQAEDDRTPAQQKRGGATSRSGQAAVDEPPDAPEVPTSIGEVRKKLKEIEALNQRILDPPPGQTVQEAIEEIREELGQVP